MPVGRDRFQQVPFLKKSEVTETYAEEMTRVMDNGNTKGTKTLLAR